MRETKISGPDVFSGFRVHATGSAILNVLARDAEHACLKADLYLRENSKLLGIEDTRLDPSLDADLQVERAEVSIIAPHVGGTVLPELIKPIPYTTKAIAETPGQQALSLSS